MNQINNTENWKLLTVTRGGTVSLVKGLTEEKAKELAHSLNFNRRFDHAVSGTMTHCSDGDIIRTEAFE